MSNNCFEIEEYFVALKKDGEVQWLAPRPYYDRDDAVTERDKQNSDRGPFSQCEYIVVTSKRMVEVEA